MAAAKQNQRLDKELVARGMAPSRSRAAQLITGGNVRVDGAVVTKPAAVVGPASNISVAAEHQWVSRAAHKLLGALEIFGVDPAGRRCMDAGASTGGFTQVLLHYGAEHVVAVDVGHDQLAPALRGHRQITSVEGCNLRYAEPEHLGAPFDLIVADLSFISLRLVTTPLARMAAPAADVLLMVKPQFEIGRQRLPRTGVVTSADQRREAVENVAQAAAEAGLILRGAARSPLPGQDGNAEFFLHCAADTQEQSAPDDRLDRALLDGVEYGEPHTTAKEAP
ncbi:TlyA family RNA methyltransferase [Nesterenkonia sp.]|uniref:TlyA family RNA methyltransferase n=1 Tax=Nesterenkonia sp. TaxID=704201 RepID=UPI00261C4F63|nr:TlyA family RNA methyltransferase [Nesterenkonia sp.]